MGVRDLDVVTEYPVEADLEGADPCPFSFTRLQRGDVLLPAVSCTLHVVELGVVPGTDGVAVVELRGRLFHEGAAQHGGDVREEIEAARGGVERH